MFPLNSIKPSGRYLRIVLLNVSTIFFGKREMFNSQKQAVITLIEKKGKDRSLLENWRPISLVNVDTKLIMTKAIAWRKKNVLPDIIHQNQTGCVKDRFIGETIRLTYDIMDFTANWKIFPV